MADNQHTPPTKQWKKGKEMPEKDRIRAIYMLKGMCVNGHPRRGSFAKVAEFFARSQRAICRLWKHTKENETKGLVGSPAIKSLRHKRGRKAIYMNEQDLMEHVKSIPRKKRKTTRSLALSLGVSSSTVHRMKKKKLIWRHSSALKPALTEANKDSRIMHVLNKIPKQRNTRSPLVFSSMMNEIHIGEKWFYMTEDGEAYLLAADEEPPYRSTRHKSHIQKVMFLCAMARPRYNQSTETWFDGKIGIWPVGDFEPAKRNSKHRRKGTLVWKNRSITRDVYRELMIEKVLPAILEKWPGQQESQIIIQQDGAPSHIAEDDEEWLEALEDNGVADQIVLYTQSANSADFNLNDLGFFRALQSLYNHECPSNEKEIIDYVLKAYEAYDRKKINRLWLTLQSCYNAALDDMGGNNYKIPHMGKERMEREGTLPLSLPVTDSVNFFV